MYFCLGYSLYEFVIYKMGIGKEHMDGISLDTALLFKYFRGLTTGGKEACGGLDADFRRK